MSISVNKVVISAEEASKYGLNRAVELSGPKQNLIPEVIQNVMSLISNFMNAKIVVQPQVSSSSIVLDGMEKGMDAQDKAMAACYEYCKPLQIKFRLLPP
jgi:hypothetical protein